MIPAEAVEAAARSASPRADTWDTEPESFKDQWRDEARLYLHLEEIIDTRLGPAIERSLAKPPFNRWGSKL